MICPPSLAAPLADCIENAHLQMPPGGQRAPDHFEGCVMGDRNLSRMTPSGAALWSDVRCGLSESKHVFGHGNSFFRPPPPTTYTRNPPLVQTTVNDQRLTEPTPSVAWTRVLLKRYTVQCYSENQGARYATKAIMSNSASLTQNMNIIHLEAQVSGSTHSTQ